MVRISGLIGQVNAEVNPPTIDGRSPQQQLDEITNRLRPSVTRQHQLFERELRPLLAEKGVRLVNYIDLSKDQRVYLQRYFEEGVFPILTPLAIDPSHPFPHMSNLSLNLAVSVKDPKTAKENFARVKVPKILPRFIALPEELRQYDGKSCVWVGIALEQLIAHNLEMLFPGLTPPRSKETGIPRITSESSCFIAPAIKTNAYPVLQSLHRLTPNVLRLNGLSLHSRPGHGGHCTSDNPIHAHLTVESLLYAHNSNRS